MTHGKMVRRVALSMTMAAVVSACSTASNSVDVSTGVRADARVNINSSALEHRIGFGTVVFRKEGLLTHSQVTLENHTSGTVPFEFRWEWTDVEGFQIGDTLSSWQPAVINGKERKLLSGVGPGPRATNCRLYIREPQN